MPLVIFTCRILYYSHNLSVLNAFFKILDHSRNFRPSKEGRDQFMSHSLTQSIGR